jgi:hypothetical protein
MNQHLRLLTFGILTWLLPFLISLPFYGSDGGLTIDIFAFKSLMIVSGAAIGTLLIYLYLRSLPEETNWITTGITIGISWLLINWILDVIVLVTLFEMTPTDWFIQIGSRYLLLPMMAVLAGASAHLGVEKR